MDICDKLPIDEAMNAYGDPENWFVFQGRIKPGWIRRVEQKEKETAEYKEAAKGTVYHAPGGRVR